MKWYTRAFLLLTAILLPFACVSAEPQPSGALIAPETVRPWLRQLPITPEPTLQPTPKPTPEPQDELPAELLDDDGAFRVLLIGTDAYEPDAAGRSDAMILIQVRGQSVRMVSFLRDLYVKIPGHGSTRLNAAYVYGGADLLKKTLENNFGVRVDRTLAVNFSLMVDLIDQIGGVEVDVSASERRQLNSILKYYNRHNGFAQDDGLLQEAGWQRLSGKQALSFSRIRKIDDDFHRTGRQRQVIEAILNRVRELDMFTLAGLVTANIDKVQTDLGLSDVLALTPAILNMQDIELQGMSVPIAGGYSDETINGMMVLVPNLKKNTAAIAEFLKN